MENGSREGKKSALDTGRREKKLVRENGKKRRAERSGIHCSDGDTKERERERKLANKADKGTTCEGMPTLTSQ